VRAGLLLVLAIASGAPSARADPAEDAGAPDPAAVEQALSPAGLLARDVDESGLILVRLVLPTGDLVERTVDAAGRTLRERLEGSVSDLPVVESTADSSGRPSRVVRDASGALIRYVVDGAGRPAGAEVAQDAPGL
jgi:hypothetical protein